MNDTTITVHGIPAPKGSKRHVGNGILVESSAKVKPWMEAVKWAIIDAGSPKVAGPVSVEIVFTLPRPKKYAKPKHRDTPPSTKPDGDKLERSTWDALVEMRVIEDDARIVSWGGAKHYEGSEWGMVTPGAVIQVKAVECG